MSQLGTIIAVVFKASYAGMSEASSMYNLNCASLLGKHVPIVLGCRSPQPFSRRSILNVGLLL